MLTIRLRALPFNVEEALSELFETFEAIAKVEGVELTDKDRFLARAFALGLLNALTED